MKILVVGAGLSGCSIARLLKDKKYDVSLIEKEGHLGGLCITRVNKDKLRYEPFGGRVFHTKNSKIKNFITKFDDFNGYTHRKGMIINGKLFPFPITEEAINDFEDKDLILKELNNRPKKIDKTNFETICVSIFGKRLYNYFIRNYTAKMWGTDPKNLTAEWAPKRLELRENGNNVLFKNQWQGLPKQGYSFLLEKMIGEIPVILNTSNFNPDKYDVVVSSAPIDQIMNFKFGRLGYRSLKFYYKRDESWEEDNYGTINLPQHRQYIRKTNFKVLYKQESGHNWIQYQKPLAADEDNVPMYPVNTENNNSLFDKYLKEICKTNICPIGRLGLFKYLNMDTAVEIAFAMLSVIESYSNLNAEEKYKMIIKIIKGH